MNDKGSVPFLDLRRQHRLLRQEIDAAVGQVLERADFINGSAVGEFEEEFAAFQSAPRCVAVANGTDALEIALEALSLPPASEVIVPVNSFIATSEAVTRSGHQVVFAGVDETYTLDVADVARRVTDRTAAVIAVHLYGQPADLASLRDLCDRHDLRLIEDAAQAHGAEYRGRRVGAIGDIGTFSFFPGKNLGAVGDAGAIVTSDPTLADTARRIANHGRIGKYDHDREGRNSRMDTVQAAVLRVKLGHLDEWLATRRRTADAYRSRLTEGLGAISPGCTVGERAVWALPCIGPELRLSGVRDDVLHSYHLYVIRVANRSSLRDLLDQSGVATGVHYPTILPRLGAYREHPQHSEAFACESWSRELLSLPIGEHMDEAAVERVVRAIGFSSKANQGSRERRSNG